VQHCTILPCSTQVQADHRPSFSRVTGLSRACSQKNDLHARTRHLLSFSAPMCYGEGISLSVVGGVLHRITEIYCEHAVFLANWLGR